MSSPCRRLMDQYTNMVLLRLVFCHLLCFVPSLAIVHVDFYQKFHYVLIPMLQKNRRQNNQFLPNLE